jgi:4a-hydroxytetrahydrobiopterin dehydratase
MDAPKILDKDEIEIALSDLPGWKYEDDKISKEFLFTDFVDSLNFINGLLGYFERMDHHPDVHIYYNRVLFDLTRYDIGGKVTNRDVEVAKKIEQTYDEQK